MKKKICDKNMFPIKVKHKKHQPEIDCIFNKKFNPNHVNDK